MMKKLLLVMSMCITLLPGIAHGAEMVEVTLPTFDVTLNQIKIDNKSSLYPFIVYQDITYVPMTFHDAKLLGLETEWTDITGLSVKQLSIFDQLQAQTNYTPYINTQANNNKYQATVASFQIEVSGTQINNSEEAYPLLIFRDVTYFPLTWRFAVEEFGWKYQFDQQKGLVITPPTISMTTQPSNTVPTAVLVTGSIVNIRSQANTDSEVLTQVTAGAMLDIVGINGQWYQVKINSSQNGWIASWLVETVTSEELSEINDFSMNYVVNEEKNSTLEFLVGQEDRLVVSSRDGNKLVLLAYSNYLAQQKTLAGNKMISSVIARPIGNQVEIVVELAEKSIVSFIQNAGNVQLNVRGYNSKSNNVTGKVIVLDPGHGNLKENGVVDPGAIGSVLGFTDREVGETIALKLKTLLEEQGATVFMTRDLNRAAQALTLVERADLASQVNADIYISIHGNALASNKTKNGAEVYFWGNSKLTPKAQQEERKNLAYAVSNEIMLTSGRSSVVKESNFVVIRESQCPSILVEAGYLTNAEDEALLATDEYQMKIARGILNGLQNYFQ